MSKSFLSRSGFGFGLAHGAYLAAAGAAAVEDAGAVGLHAAHRDAGRELEPLEDLARVRIDAAQLALLGFQGRVPELAVRPGHAGDEAIRLDRAQDGAGRGVDLVDLARAVLAHPERALGPGEARVAALGGRRDRGDHLARARVDLLDALIGELPQVLAVEGGACVGGDGELADQRAALRVDRDQALAAGEPDTRAVEGYAVDRFNARIRAVFAEDLRLRGAALAVRFHAARLLKPAAHLGVTSVSRIR